MALASRVQPAVVGKASCINSEDSEFPRDGKGRLTDIIRTFREHNRRLVERMVQCEKQREQETSFYKRKQSLKLMRGKVDSMRQVVATELADYHTIRTSRERLTKGLTK